MPNFIPTKAMIKEMVIDFIYTKNDIFSDIKRGRKAIDSKVPDIVYEEVIKEKPQNITETRSIVDELMRGAIELADRNGFVKIIYDFI